MKKQDCGWGAEHKAHPHPGIALMQCPGTQKERPVAMKKTAQPVKRCAKWCGRGCTEAEYQAAVSRAIQSVINAATRDFKPYADLLVTKGAP